MKAKKTWRFAVVVVLCAGVLLALMVGCEEKTVQIDKKLANKLLEVIKK